MPNQEVGVKQNRKRCKPKSRPYDAVFLKKNRILCLFQDYGISDFALACASKSSAPDGQAASDQPLACRLLVKVVQIRFADSCWCFQSRFRACQSAASVSRSSSSARTAGRTPDSCRAAATSVGG